VKVTGVLCHFYKCTPLVKLKLLRAYCSDIYGSTLWNLSDSSIEEVCVAWRKGFKTRITVAHALSPVSSHHCHVATER